MQQFINSLPMRRYWLVRLYLALSVLTVSLIACFEPRTMIYMLIAQSGPIGWWCVLALACVAALAACDVLVNDLLPEPCRFAFAMRNRHIIYMLLALGLVSTGYVIARQAGVTAFHARLLLDASVATLIAYFDVFARHKSCGKEL